MPALRKPTAILEAEGAFKNHPSRRRGEEPDTGRGVGPAPEGMAEDEMAAWDEIVSNTASRVWQSSDRHFLEQLATLIARSRRSSEGLGLHSMQVLVGMLARAGMTPADRSKVVLGKSGEAEKPKSGLASFR